jgi:hypothetical protein
MLSNLQELALAGNRIIDLKSIAVNIPTLPYYLNTSNTLSSR